jgi:hypothetical protein
MLNSSSMPPEGSRDVSKGVMSILMRVLSLLVLVCSSSALVACSADDDADTLTIENLEVSMTTTADVDNVHRGQSIPVHIETNGFPVDPYLTPPPGHVHDAVFFKIFLDDVDSRELTATAAVSFNVEIPLSTSLGPHELICKTFSHDGEDTGSDSSIDINVTASATVTAPVNP